MVIWNGTDYIFYYMSKTKSRVRIAKNLNSEFMENMVTVTQDIKDTKTGSSIARFEKIANYFVRALNEHGVKRVFLEGYSLGSKGKVFSIAENTAVLKYILWKLNIEVTIFAPTTIKKYATDKGNANKDLMKESYESTVQLKTLHPISHYKDSPYTDCIDAYWILQYGLDTLK